MPVIPALWEAETDHLRSVRDQPGQHGETPSLLKIQKISWASWRMPVIPATQEAEAGELPEPRRRRLRWAEIMLLHSSLGNKSETPSQKKKKRLWDPSKFVAYANSFFPFHCWVIHDMDVPVCFTTHQLRDLLMIFSFWLVQIKLLWTFMTFMCLFLSGCKFSFSGDKYPGV